MNKAGFVSMLLIAAAVLPVGCGAPRESRPAPQQYYYYDNYQPWGGPGWYYGVYYSNEWGYRNWRRRHWGGQRWDGGHYRRGGSRHHGGGHRH